MNVIDPLAPAPTHPPLAVNLMTAARMIGVSDRTVWTMTRDGRLPSVRIGTRLLVRVADLETFLARAARPRQGPPSEPGSPAVAGGNMPGPG